MPSDKDVMPFLKELSIAPLPNLTSFTFYNLPEQISIISMFCRPNIPKLSTIFLFQKDDIPVTKPVVISIPKTVTKESDLKSQQKVTYEPITLPPQATGQSTASTISKDGSTETSKKTSTNVPAVNKVDPKTLKHLQTSYGYIVTSIDFESMTRVIVSLNGLYLFYCYVTTKKPSTLLSQLKEVTLFNCCNILDGHNLWSETAKNEIQV